ncbi:hypothetical protein MUK42_34364, partial [Musa troglodytarum]
TTTIRRRRRWSGRKRRRKSKGKSEKEKANREERYEVAWRGGRGDEVVGGDGGGGVRAVGGDSAKSRAGLQDLSFHLFAIRLRGRELHIPPKSRLLVVISIVLGVQRRDLGRRSPQP